MLSKIKLVYGKKNLRRKEGGGEAAAGRGPAQALRLDP